MSKLKTSSTCKFAVNLNFQLSCDVQEYYILQLSDQLERKIATNILFVRIGSLTDIPHRTGSRLSSGTRTIKFNDMVHHLTFYYVSVVALMQIILKVNFNFRGQKFTGGLN